MTVTVEIMKQETLNLFEALENMGLIHIQPPVSQSAETVHEDPPPYQWLRGCCKNIKGGSVEEFLADCHADKEREFEIERRQEEERERFAKAKLSS